MKKTLQFILWLIAVLLIIILIKTLTFRSLQIHTEPVAMVSFGDESAAHLSKAVTFPTISYSPDSPVDTVAFNGYLEFLNEAFPLVRSKLTREVFSDFSLLYRWQGKDSSLKPIIFLAHSDVVPPGDLSSWEKNPFSGEIDGTYIWGRGTLDDKAGMVSILEAVEKLLSEGFAPGHTIYLAFGHDEEISGIRGAGTLAKVLESRGIEAEFILDEGNAIYKDIFPMIRKPVALVGTSEKGYVSVRLTVEMPGGHSSVPEKESALIVLNKAVYYLVKHQMKAKISDPLNDYINYIGPEMPFFAKAIFSNKWLFKGAILNIFKGSSVGNALVRTTTAPTIMQAGIKDNIVPAKAEAVINFRILPGETSGDVMDHIEKVIGDKRVKATFISEGKHEPAPVSPSNAAGFTNIFIALRQIYPEAVISPTMMVAGSDSRHYTGISKNIYRFAPIMVNPEDIVRIHGLNERTRIEDFKRGIGFYYRLLQLSAY